MGETADVKAYSGQVVHTVSACWRWSCAGSRRDRCRGPLHLDAEQGYLLSDAIVEFARDAGTLGLLGTHETAGQIEPGELGGFAIVDVDAASDVPCECAVGEESRGTGITDPVVLAVVSSQAVFHREGPPLSKAST